MVGKAQLSQVRRGSLPKTVRGAVLGQLLLTAEIAEVVCKAGSGEGLPCAVTKNVR